MAWLVTVPILVLAPVLGELLLTHARVDLTQRGEEVVVVNRPHLLRPDADDFLLVEAPDWFIAGLPAQLAMSAPLYPLVFLITLLI